MRTFIAIEIPEEIKTALAALQSALRKANAAVSWTNPENIHLTLKFLGEIEERRLAGIARASMDAAAGVPPLTLRLDRTGVYPNARQPRVIWAGLAGEIELLQRMQRGLEEQLAAIGVKGDEKLFRPHLTVGRVKSNRNAREMVVQADLYELPAFSFEVREILVMKSELLPAGAKYTALAKAALGTHAS